MWYNFSHTICHMSHRLHRSLAMQRSPIFYEWLQEASHLHDGVEPQRHGQLIFLVHGLRGNIKHSYNQASFSKASSEELFSNASAQARQPSKMSQDSSSINLGMGTDETSNSKQHHLRHLCTITFFPLVESPGEEAVEKQPMQLDWCGAANT